MVRPKQAELSAGAGASAELMPIPHEVTASEEIPVEMTGPPSSEAH